MARYTEISIDKLTDEIDKALIHYGNYIYDVMLSETRGAMKSLVQKTKETAPEGKRSKHYRDNITSKVLKKSRVGYGRAYRELWYVKGPDYRLSHLLNNGHALRNGDRYEGTNFISDAYEQVEGAYIEALVRAIEYYR